MSSAFMMLLLDELPEGWTLELASPDEWAGADEVDHDFDTDPPTPVSDPHRGPQAAGQGNNPRNTT